MLNSEKNFDIDDPMGMLEKAESRLSGYDPGNVESSAVREIIKDEMFIGHCRALSGQRAFLQKKGLAEPQIIDELWKRLTYK